MIGPDYAFGFLAYGIGDPARGVKAVDPMAAENVQEIVDGGMPFRG